MIKLNKQEDKMQEKQEKITFDKLSFWLKVGIIGGMIYSISLLLAFTVGLIYG